ncbi:tRNA lysidine(34) synthetase TilS [Mucilaginibacter sp. CSA2-8R]|uniref:tRNA lysidine(34) synthetase TilS n=1 Tax=Mucilaginibacter sp. CSA2-8R TaxID=3141542 RepID=UPI00315CF349
MLPVQNFTAYIEQHQLFNRPNKVLAALSGGMDSVLLVHLLKAAGYTFGIAHCNFQLRDAEANADQDFCRSLAAELQVPFYTVSFDTLAYAKKQKISIQMAARELRYQWFEQVRQQHQYDAIALAHHQNDTIETILLNLTRGTGIAGLHGILPKNGYWVRPLLFLSRQQITDIVLQLQNKLPYREDSSNASTKYARNKIRHEVIPKLKELNPNLENTFERSLSHFRELEQLLQLQMQVVKHNLVKQHENEIHILKADVLQLQPQRLLLGELLKEYDFNDTILDDVISALPKHAGRVFESGKYQLLLDRDKLIITPKKDLNVLPVYLNRDSEEIFYADTSFHVIRTNAPYLVTPHGAIAAVDEDLLVYPLTFRNWQEGDYFMPLGMPSRKKLSDFFINQKVPRHQKIQIPILVNGNGDIIWVAGYRLDDRYKLTPQTKKVTIFELLKP